MQTLIILYIPWKEVQRATDAQGLARRLGADELCNPVRRPVLAAQS
jgi:hypothetical protein